MYQVFLKTWYQETPLKVHDEIMYESDDVDQACHYFLTHVDDILDSFPVQEMGIRIINKIG